MCILWALEYAALCTKRFCHVDPKKAISRHSSACCGRWLVPSSRLHIFYAQRLPIISTDLINLYTRSAKYVSHCKTISFFRSFFFFLYSLFRSWWKILCPNPSIERSFLLLFLFLFLFRFLSTIRVNRFFLCLFAKTKKKTLSTFLLSLANINSFSITFSNIAAERFQRAWKLTERIRTDQRGESIFELRDYIGRRANTRIGKSAANGKYTNESL